MAIKVGFQHYEANREYTIDYTISVLRSASDWQEGQNALANHPSIGQWLRATYGCDGIAEIQSIIREAEERLGDDLPY